MAFWTDGPYGPGSWDRQRKGGKKKGKGKGKRPGSSSSGYGASKGSGEVKGPHPDKFCHHCQVYGHHTLDCFHKAKVDNAKGGGKSKGHANSSGGKGGKHSGWASKSKGGGSEHAELVLDEPPRCEEEQLYAMMANDGESKKRVNEDGEFGVMTFVLDSGASRHIIKEVPEKVTSREEIRFKTAADGESMVSQVQGDIVREHHGQIFKLRDCAHCPGASQNLLSTTRLWLDSGLLFRADGYILTDSKLIPLKRSGNHWEITL